MGAQTYEGVTNANPAIGLDNSIDYLMTNVVNPPGTGDGTRAAVWHRANGNVSADVHVVGFAPQAWGRNWVRFTLELSIPDGVFA
jgi:hypothetical protein